MPRRKKKHEAARNEPKQERSRRLVEAILEAAIRVLARDGAAAFTTIRVAERAGVSVGSLYQYFPDKQAIRAWYNDPGYRPLIARRHAVARSVMIAIEGA